MVDNNELDNDLDTVEDKPITAKQLNSALTNYRRQIQKDLQSTLSGFQAAQQQPKVQDLPEEPNTIKALREEIKALKDKDRVRDQELKTERLSKTARDLLSKKGIESKYLDLAFKTIKDDIGWDEDGTMVMKDEFGVNVPLSEALDNWATSETSQLFKSPKQLNGAGSQTSKSPGQPNLPQKLPNDGKPRTEAEARTMLVNAIKGGGSLLDRS